MSETESTGPIVNARVVYWGADGAGKSTCIQHIYSKLRSDNRGEISVIASPVEPEANYETLPIELGKVGGVRTRIQIIVAPGEPAFRATRTQLLDHVDGIVFVVDAQRNRLDANLAAFRELRETLSAQGISLDDIPLVIQHNKRDIADYLALEELHRQLALPKVAIFDGIATQGKGVLQVLTTVSKQVIRYLRERGPREDQIVPPTPTAAPAPPETDALTAPEPAFAPPAKAIPLDVTVPPLAPAAPIDDPMGAAAPEAIILDGDTAPNLSPLPTDASPEPTGAIPMAEVLEAEAMSDETQKIAETTAAAQASFEEPSIAEAEESPQSVELDGSLRVLSVGEAWVASDQKIHLPLTVSDPSGRRFSLSLTLQLGPPLEDKEQ